jgi:D-aminoacyl-tRNA deacylase
MRLVIQRVSEASVSIDAQVVGQIDRGLLILVGIEAADTIDDANWLAGKLVQMRIFSDSDGKMNLSLIDISGSALVVSQFTLHAACKKGNRPSFIRAARPDQAVPIYEHFLAQIQALTGKAPQAGRFGADMQVSLINDGPVTIIIDSKGDL